MENRSHSLHILFPLGLLAAFAASAVMVLLLTAGVWQESRARSQAGFEAAAAASYLTEKLRQNDSGAVTLGTIGDCPALILETRAGDAQYDTYLYCHGGSLRELMANRSIAVTPDMGRSLLPLEAIQLIPGDNGLVEILCTGADGEHFRIFCALRAGEVA